MKTAAESNEHLPDRTTSPDRRTAAGDDDDHLLLLLLPLPPTEEKKDQAASPPSPPGSDLLAGEVAIRDMKVTEGGGEEEEEEEEDLALLREELAPDGGRQEEEEEEEEDLCDRSSAGVVGVDYRCEYSPGRRGRESGVVAPVSGMTSGMTSAASDAHISGDDFGGRRDSQVEDYGIEREEKGGGRKRRGRRRKRRRRREGKQPPATEKRHQMNNAVSTPTSNKTQDSRGRQSGDLTPSDKTTSFSTSSSSSPTTPKQQRRRPPRDRGKSSAKHYGNGGKWASSSGGGSSSISSISISSIWLLRTLSDKVLLMTVLVSALASALSSSAIVRAEGTKGGEKGIGPVFLEPVPNVTVAKGRDASLTCTVDHLGMHKVAWIHLDRQMILSIHNHIITRTPRFSVTHDSHKTWTLQVTAVEEEDRGHYMCQVNTKPMISQTGFLQVVVPPNIVDAMSSPSSIVVREKDEVTLSCHAEGFPEPQIKWKREDAQSIKTSDGRKVSQLDHPALPLGQVSRMDMGAYLCIASNGVPPSISKRITLDVEFSPQMHVPNQLVGAPLSTNVTLECFVEAHPRAITYWEFAGSMVMNTSRIATDTIEKLYRIHMLLIIRDLQESDFGTYKCISKNSIAETDGSITLNKTYRPTSPPQTMLHSSDDDGKSHLARSRGGKEKLRKQLEVPRRRFQDEELDRRLDEDSRKRLHDSDRRKYDLEPSSGYRDEISNMINNPPIDSSASSGLPAIVWLGVLTSVTLVSVLV